MYGLYKSVIHYVIYQEIFEKYNFGNLCQILWPPSTLELTEWYWPKKVLFCLFGKTCKAFAQRLLTC